MAVKMGHLFISYSHKDKAYAHKLAKALETRGFNAWIDDRIDYGSTWPEEIEKRLDTCEAFIVVMSENSSRSSWVQNEVARAKRKGKPIFPLLLSGETWLSLEATQYVDVRNGSLPPEQFYDCLGLTTGTSDPHPAENNPESNKRKTKDRPILQIEIGQILKVVVFFTLVVVGVIFSTWPKTQGPSSTPTPLQLRPTGTATSTLVFTPSDTPSDTLTPTLPPTATPAPLVIVNTNALGGWVPDFNSSKADKEKNKINVFEDAIRLTYEIGVDGYVVITKSFDSEKLRGTEGISFLYSGTGEYNTLEFKLLLRYPEHTGDTIYGIVWRRETNTDGKWEKKEVRYSDIWCWGPAEACVDHPEVDITKVDRLDFAVSNKPGDDPGPGWILIKDIFGIVP